MSTNTAINGMGRIGRVVLRIALQNKNLNVVTINTSCPPETIAHLIDYGTTHGKYNLKVEPIGNGLQVRDRRIKLIIDRNPENLPWEGLGINITIDATGRFDHDDKAIAHIRAGAKKMLLTGPSRGGHVQTMVKSVNDDQLGIEAFGIFSDTSYTTNCIGPAIGVLNSQFGIVNGLMATVHTITNGQKNIDNPHKGLRRTRSCNESIIPTSTGTTKTLKEVLPELEGKLHGMALRVSTRNVPFADLVIDLEREVTAEEVNQAFKSTGSEGIIEVEHQPLVSVGFNTNPHSAIIDAESTVVMLRDKVKVIAWYNSEWGYSNRVVDVAEQVGALLTSKEAVSVG